MVERFFTVPLDYANPTGEKIRVFARHLIPKSKAKTIEEEEKLPYSETSVVLILNHPAYAMCSALLARYIELLAYLLLFDGNHGRTGGPGFEVELQGNSSFAGEVRGIHGPTV